MLFRLTKYLIAIALILSTLFFGLISLIDKEKVIEKINDKIKSDFGKDIKYDHEIDLNFFPFPQIKLKNIKYSDRGLNFNLYVKELNLISSWRSILTLDPEILNLHLFEPKLNNFKDSNYFLVNNAKNSEVEAKFDVAVEKINLKNKPLELTTFKIVIKDDTLFINNFKSNYLDTTFKSDVEYNFTLKKIKGKFKTEGLLIDESFFQPKSKFKIKKAIFTCTMDYMFDNSLKKKTLKNFSINKGDCKSTNVTITGVDVKNILSKVDNIDTFQDFFDLFNLKKFRGITQLNTLFFNFKFFKNILNISNFETRNEVIKIKSFGNYNIISKDLNADNKILLKTKKFPSLPQFSVFIDGNLEDYKVTYDFDKVKAVILKKGIGNLIGKRKKIIINPKSIDKILKENPIKELNTEKLFDLFLD